MDHKFSANKADVDLAEKIGRLRINEGTDVPLLLTNFVASCFPEEYITKLYKIPTPIQSQTWPLAIQGKDIISVAKPGSGRKLGFLIPAFIHLKRLQDDSKRGPMVLVLCPTDDIATEVYSESVIFGVPASVKTTVDLVADVVIATLEGLIEILENKMLSLEHFTYLVLYEADNLLKASGDPQIHKLLPHLQSKHRQTLIFTSIWSKEARDIASVFLHDQVMDQSKCTTTNLKAKAKGNRFKPRFFKVLKKLWEKEEPGLPWPKGRFTKANTLLVDDSPHKGLCNPKFTAIFPIPYSFKDREDKSLGVEGDLRLYLEKVAAAEDVQCFVKDNPFGQPAMTESHPEWNYYLPAMRTLRNI